MNAGSGVPRYSLAELVRQLARWQEATLTRRSADQADVRPDAVAGLTRLASLDALAELPEAERRACVVVVADQDDLERLAAVPGGGPGLLVTSRDTEPPADLLDVPIVHVDSTRLALASLSVAFDDRPRPQPGVHPSATIDDTAELGVGVSVGAGVVVAAGAKVGDGSQLRPHCYVGAEAVLGQGCVIHPYATVYDRVELGDGVILHAGAVIGADGFGYAASPRGAVKIRHLGSVKLGDEVEIGANSAVDRGTLDDTVVGARTKIDNHCQVGHNVRIGTDCLIAGMTGIAGSVVIGDGVIIGGAVGIADHVTIGSGARIAGRSGVTKDVPPGETWAGFPARSYRQYARALYLADRLEEIWQRVRHLRKGSEDDPTPDGRTDGR